MVTPHSIFLVGVQDFGVLIPGAFQDWILAIESMVIVLTVSVGSVQGSYNTRQFEKEFV